MTEDQYLLNAEGLKTHFFTEKGVVKAVDGIDFRIRKGATLGMVGESGCGKTVTALSIMRLVASPPGRIVSGKLIFKGRDLLTLADEEMRAVRGKEISMVFQEPMTSLNPVFTVGNQVMEAVLEHEKVGRREARDRTIEMFRKVGIPDAEGRIRDYPNQLSGGLRQRVMIAMALCLSPSLLIADEPTTALDVTIQAQILDLLKKLKEEYRMSVLLITHDLGIIAEMADDVLIMYAGQVVEYTDINTIFEKPMHPYTQGLMDSIPALESEDGSKIRLKAIPGIVPELVALPPWCRFEDRCPMAIGECRAGEPELVEIEPSHWVRCIRV